MNWNWKREAPQILLVVAMFTLAAYAWPRAPERLPTHWNYKGEVDGYGGKFEGFLLLPILAAGTYALLLVLPRFDPGKRNYEKFVGSYTLIRIGIVGFLALLQSAMTLIAFGYAIDMSTTMGLLLGALLCILGATMRNIEPNWFVGVRTPWTLSSKLSWTKTHRFAGHLFFALGLLAASACALRAAWAIVALVVAVFVSVLAIFVYSYWVWKNDPVRAPAIEPANGANAK